MYVHKKIIKSLLKIINKKNFFNVYYYDEYFFLINKFYKK